MNLVCVLLLLAIAYLIQSGYTNQKSTDVALAKELKVLSGTVYNLGHTEGRKVVQTVETSWRSGNSTVKVVTPKEPGDTDAEWAAKHASAVAAMKQVFPENPE